MPPMDSGSEQLPSLERQTIRYELRQRVEHVPDERHRI